jgi:DNA-binding NarL/FixJ family response regulator
MKKILLVDDHIMFREGLANILKAQVDFQVIGQAGTVPEAIDLARTLQPDLVLMDYSLQEGSGVEATQAILEDRPETIVVFLTVFDVDEILFAAIRCGAKGYLLKSQSSVELLESLRAIEKGEAAVSRSMTKHILNEFSRLGPSVEPQSSKLSKLTLREFQVINELTSGATNKEIAKRLSISVTTVKNLVHSALFKLGLKNRRDLAWFARQQGLMNLSGTDQLRNLELQPKQRGE